MHAYRDQYAQTFNLGRGVVLIAISADSVEELAAWARDDEFPFLMASDANLEAARAYGAVHSSGRVTNRSLFVIGPDGRIAYTATPFREVDPTAYEELAAVIDRLD
ncbi:MAG: peroxiredoxin family protein [Gemmatimonadetes bacterium]|nr:peroxiredoxin family protein [Gemmatimonadota bacterium]